MSDEFSKFTFKSPSNPLQFNMHGKAYLTIKPDGSVELGPDISKDEAIRGFWDYASQFGPNQEIERLREELAASQWSLQQCMGRLEADPDDFASVMDELTETAAERDALRVLLQEAYERMQLDSSGRFLELTVRIRELLEKRS